MPKNCFIYLRVSTSKQTTGDKLGLSAQKRICLSWADSKGYSREQIHIFQDEGISGAAPVHKRPGLSALLEELRAGDVLLVQKLDRLSRDLMTNLLLEELLKKSRAGLVSVSGEGTTGTDPTSLLFRRILQSFSEFERGVCSARTSAAMQTLIKKNKTTGKVPYGFRADKNGNLLKNPEEILTLFQIQDWRKYGLSYRAVCDKLNEQKTLNRQGRPWNVYLVHTVWKGWKLNGRERYERLTAAA